MKGDDRIQGGRSGVADGKKKVVSFILHSYVVSEIVRHDLAEQDTGYRNLHCSHPAFSRSPVPGLLSYTSGFSEP